MNNPSKNKNTDSGLKIYSFKPYNLERAISLLEKNDYTCVLCKEDQLYTSRKSGVAPMVKLLSSGTNLKGFSAADKIVGKAAAMLYILAEVQAVYASVMSRDAIGMLSKHGIMLFCNRQTERIINRKQTGPCPMDQAVAEIEDPQAGFLAIKQTLAELQKAHGHISIM